MSSRGKAGVAVLTTVIAMLASAAAAMAANPIGFFDGYNTRGGGAVRVHGWTADPDSKTRAMAVNFWLNPGTSSARGPYQIGRAAMKRNDVASAYPGYGAYHGFDMTIYGLPGGYHNVCAYGTNYGSGSTTLLSNGCKGVSIPYSDLRETNISNVSSWDLTINCVKWATGGMPSFTTLRNPRTWGRETLVKFLRANVLSYAVQSLGCTGLAHYQATPHQPSTPPAVGFLDGGCDVEQARAMGFKPERGDCNH